MRLPDVHCVIRYMYKGQAWIWMASSKIMFSERRRWAVRREVAGGFCAGQAEDGQAGPHLDSWSPPSQKFKMGEVWVQPDVWRLCGWQGKPGTSWQCYSQEMPSPAYFFDPDLRTSQQWMESGGTAAFTGKRKLLVSPFKHFYVHLRSEHNKMNDEHSF